MKYEDPITTADEGPVGGTTTTHPCFAQIGASRVSGTGTFLYASGFKHQHYVTVQICRSELKRDLSHDWHFGREELIEVALTESQWATFVASPNQGSGIPCTLQHVNCDRVPQLPDTPKLKHQFDGELRETLQKSVGHLKALREQIDAMNISGKKKAELLSSLRMAESNITCNLSFVADQFGEHMETVIDKAKVEVEAYVNSTIVRAGIAALNEKSTLQLTGD